MGCGSIYYAKKSCESSIVTDIGAQNRYDLNFAPAGLKMKNELSTPNWTMIPGQGRTVRAPPNNFVARLARRPREARARRGRQASCRHKIGAIPSVHKRDALAWPATSIQLYVKSWPISFCAHVHEIFTIHSPKKMGLIGPTKMHRKLLRASCMVQGCRAHIENRYQNHLNMYKPSWYPGSYQAEVATGL